MQQVDKIMRQAVAGNVFPGAVLLVSTANKIIFFEAYGYTNIFTKTEVTRDTFFDLASLTKPLATTLAVMMLIQQEKLNLDQDLASILMPFKKSEKGRITIRHLLAHHSGLPDYRPYYMALVKQPLHRRGDLLQNLLLEEPLVNSVGREALYSDLGFMLLRWVVETISKKPLDHFTTEEIYRPLGIENLFFPGLKPEPLNLTFAATEFCSWRKILLNGVVHDENAYVVGRAEGHSGLFGTAHDVHTLLWALWSAGCGDIPTPIFQKELLQLFFQRHQNSDRGLGFDTPARIDSSCGRHFSENSVGHLGYTGTSFWMDLEKAVIVVLLTNRVHPSRHNITIRAFRPELHDTVMNSM